MKKIISVVALGLFLLCGTVASAATFATGGIKYHILSDSTVEVAPQSNPAYTGEINIPATVTNGDKTYTVVAVYDGSFMNTTITKVTLPPTMKQLKTNSFLGCSKLGSINLPEGLMVLGSQALGNTGITEITIPNTVTSIGQSCFFGTPLKGLTIPASVGYIGSSVVGNCNNMEYLVVDPDSKFYCTVDNVLYDKGKTYVLGYPGKCCVNVVLEPTVRTMEAHCGYGNRYIESLTLPEGLTYVEMGAAAYGAQRLTKINFSSTIETIHTQAFMTCPSLKELEFPASLKLIRSDAFNGDKAINKITCHAVTPPTLESAAFPSSIFSTAELIVPEEGYEAYTKDAMWSKFRKIIAKKEGEAPDNSASVQGMVSPKKQPLTNPVNFAFGILNEGKKDISSVAGKLTVGEFTTSEVTLSDLQVKAGSTGNILFPADLSSASLQAGTRYNMSFELTKVNGVENPADNKKLDFKVEFIQVQDTTGAGQATICQNIDNAINHLGGKVQHIDAAFKFTDPNLVGAKVVGAKVLGLPSAGVSGVRVWNSSVLSTQPNGNIMDVAPVAFGDDEYVDVVTPFTNAVTLTAEGVYFGIAVDITDGGIGRPIAVYEPKNIKGNLYISTDFNDFDETYSEFGTLGMILYVQTGDKTPGLKVVSPASVSAGVKGQPFDITYNVQNYTKEPIHELEYTYNVGAETKSGKIELETPLPAYMTQINEVTIPYEAIGNAGLFDGSLNITKVNGGDNKLSVGWPTSVSVGEFQTYHRPIMEEYTGTACGYCPRGSLAMNVMEEWNPDFISAAYHNYPGAEDPMRLTTKMPVSITGAPGCMLDRNGLTIDPYWGTDESYDRMGIIDDYAKQAAILAPCDIALKTEWIAEGDNQKSGIKVMPTVTYSFVEKDQKYSLGYLLTIDSLKHPGENNWEQLNYFKIDRYSGNDTIMPIIYGGGGFDHFGYNHVVFDMTAARGANPVDYTAIKVGQPYNYTKTFNLAENSLVEKDWLPTSDLTKVNIIAFVIDGKGVIRNAVKVRAGEESVGVSPIVAEPVQGPITYYDLMGRRVQNPQHGIYVRVQGNKASKVIL